VNITLNPSELENEGALDEILKKKYEEQVEAYKAETQREDVSDIIAEQERKRKRKAKPSSESESKNYKDFKF